MPTQIGQLRFEGSGCVSSVSSTIKYKDVAMGESTSSTSFKDIEIIPNNEFVRDEDYYISLQIPQDMNYDLSFNIKLTKVENQSTTVYQFLRGISINRGGSGVNVYNVVLYEKSDGLVAAMIPKPYIAGTANTKDDLYYNESNGNYYLGEGGTRYTRTTKINDISIAASWKQELGDNYGVFELTFRPQESGFSSILIEMVRSAEDYSIQRLNDAGMVEFGRIVDISKVKYKILRVVNLVNSINRDKTLSRIAVNGHPGLVMVINGEEIRVGANGLYELGSLPIASLGIIAEDGNYSNNWVIDYQYDTQG